MSDFVITVNSTVDVPKEWLEERNVPVVPLKYTIDGETYEDMNGLSAKTCSIWDFLPDCPAPATV